MTEAAAPRVWLSAHLEHVGSVDALLREAIHPFVERWADRGQAERFFFVRGRAERDRVRLRLRAAPGVAPDLRAALGEHLAGRCPVRWVPYEPETARYGGPLGVRIAERQFDASSRAVLAALALSRAGTEELRLGTAVQLGAGFAAGLGFSSEQARDFFRRVSELLLGYALGPCTPEEHPRRRERTLRAFDDALEGHPGLRADVPELFDAATHGALGGADRWFTRWVEASRATGRALRRALASGRLAPPDPGPDAHGASAPEVRALGSILASYVHMTHNRLGVANRDESFVAWVLARSLGPRGAGAGRP